MKKIKLFLEEEITKFTKKDYYTMLVIVVLYGFLSFFNLGDMKAPNTFYRPQKGNTITIQFENEEDLAKMKIFGGEKSSTLRIQTSQNGIDYEERLDDIKYDIFSWKEERMIEKAKYIKIEFLEDASIGELAFYNNSKSYIKYQIVQEDAKSLNDEKELIPERRSYKNSMMFDEIYFGTTAYQYVFHLPIYEWTHPPLGKVLQSIPIYLTHYMSPFLYRTMGNMAGILMLVVMYCYGSLFMKKRKYAIASSLLMAFDTFHFAHTRMGTVDSHLVLFIMTSILFMVFFTRKQKTIDLFLSGLFFALSISVKWTGFYGGLALAIIYFSHLFQRKREIPQLLLKGILFFVIVPLVIYVSIYLVFHHNYYETTNIKNIMKEQQKMYNYHSKLDAEHFFSSKWYTWPISYKPVWYFEEDIGEAKKETISGVGNIVIWIPGALSIIYAIYSWLRKKDKYSFFLTVSFLSLWLPYIFIGRIMYLYHYFPSLPFIFLSLISLLKKLEERTKTKIILPVYLALSLFFFIIYYPVVSGLPFSNTYIEKLRLYDTWYF